MPSNDTCNTHNCHTDYFLSTGEEDILSESDDSSIEEAVVVPKTTVAIVLTTVPEVVEVTTITTLPEVVELTTTQPSTTSSEEMTTATNITQDSNKIMDLEKKLEELRQLNDALHSRVKKSNATVGKPTKMPDHQVDKLIKHVKIEIFPTIKFIPKGEWERSKVLPKCFLHLKIEENDIKRISYEKSMKKQILMALSDKRNYVATKMRRAVIGKWAFDVMSIDEMP